MSKVDFKPGNMVYPLPAVMVSCGTTPEDYNIITVAWTGTICSDPPMVYISVRKSRNSYNIIKESGCFVINLTTEHLAKATDWCGCRPGSRYNKWEMMGLTPIPAKLVDAPIIEESPVNIECEVTEIKELGTHDMFMARVVNVQASTAYLDEETGAFDLAGAKPIVYNHGAYYKMGEKIGKFGFSVQKKKKTNTKKKR